MKKLFFTFFAISALFAFSACGSDDDDEPPVDYTLHDNTPLVGSYTGKCKVEVTDIVRPAKENNESNVKLDRTSDAKILTLETTEFGRILDSKLTDFMNTQAKDAYTFSMNGFKLTNFTGEAIPSYVTEWFSDDFTEINNVTISLNATNAKYTIASKTLDFVYNGNLEIKGKVNDVDRDVTYKVKYTYSVIKK